MRSWPWISSKFRSLDDNKDNNSKNNGTNNNHIHSSLCKSRGLGTTPVMTPCRELLYNQVLR